MSEQYLPTYIDNVDNSISIVDSSDSISYYKTENKINTLSAKNMVHKKVDDNLNLCAFDGSNFNPVITINNNNSDCTIETNLNVSGIINISKLAINGDYGSNTQYLKSGGPDSDLTWDTITSSSSLWTTSGNDIYYDSGNIGIGNTTPQNKLDVKSSSEIIARFRSTLDSLIIVESEASSNREIGYVIKVASPEGYWGMITDDDPNLHFTHKLAASPPSGANFSTGYGHTKMIIQTDGKVGINKTIPSAYLHVGSGTYSIPNSGTFYGTSGQVTSDNNTTRGNICARFDSVVAADSYIAFSDRRIKTNIMDVPDNLALQQLRNIPCRYYEYIDKLQNGLNKTIGFIAQEVKTVMPMAIIETQSIIPNVYKNINCTWTSNADKFNMSSTDLLNVSGILYKFYVSNATDFSDEKIVEITGNNDNTFTFDAQYTNVFCYGSEVYDFHTIDKAKLFALNFSATQEIDRIQQTHITEIASLKSEVSTLKTENQQQQTKINELTSIIDKLKTANSFEEFKETF